MHLLQQNTFLQSESQREGGSSLGRATVVDAHRRRIEQRRSLKSVVQYRITICTVLQSLQEQGFNNVPTYR